jgi:flagellar basal-body rod protein FlgB
MIDPIFHNDTYQLAQRLLDATVLRQKAIASNVANAETPGYRRLDVAPDFDAQLKARMAAGNFADSSADLKPHLAEDTTARSMRPDGNTVEMEHELLAMNNNAVQHEFLNEVVSFNLKQLKAAISGQPMA